jgi:hypothetical protein
MRASPLKENIIYSLRPDRQFVVCKDRTDPVFTQRTCTEDAQNTQRTRTPISKPKAGPLRFGPASGRRTRVRANCPQVAGHRSPIARGRSMTMVSCAKRRSTTRGCKARHRPAQAVPPPEGPLLPELASSFETGRESSRPACFCRCKAVRPSLCCRQQLFRASLPRCCCRPRGEGDRLQYLRVLKPVLLDICHRLSACLAGDLQCADRWSAPSLNEAAKVLLLPGCR